MKKIILAAAISAFTLILIFQGIRFRRMLQTARAKLESVHIEKIRLSYGEITYTEHNPSQSDGTVLLCLHGLFGGYDQGIELGQFAPDSVRVIAPSRFGYPGSDIDGDGSPGRQAAALAELIDALKIDRVYLIGASAGGTPAIRFALDFPERTAGLILFSSAMPPAEKPIKFSSYQAPPPFLLRDSVMVLLSPLFKPILGMPAETIEMMLPIDQRRAGIVLDGGVTNPDMARNFEAYPIEKLRVRTLILHAEDDQIAPFSGVQAAASRFPELTLTTFKTGGHFISGHDSEIREAIAKFMK